MGFGSFDLICNKTAFPLCSVVGAVDQDSFFNRGILPECYARSVELANTMIFQIGNAFVHIGGIAVMLITIFNVRAKYTAIGRTEMLVFLYLTLGLIFSSLIVDCGVCPPSSTVYAYFVSVQLGLASSVCICLLYNGILYFQFWEDGTRKSMWTLRAICFAWFIINFIVSLATFKDWSSGLDFRKTGAMFVITYIVNAVILFIYVVSQVILIFFALKNYWALGAILLGVFFFVAGQILTYVFSQKICMAVKHYIDGMFFGSVCNIFTFMMIYKFWDMITTDDLEFSVSSVEQGVNAFSLEDEKRGSTLFS